MIKLSLDQQHGTSSRMTDVLVWKLGYCPSAMTILVSMHPRVITVEEMPMSFWNSGLP